jgi:hypothetical protein
VDRNGVLRSNTSYIPRYAIADTFINGFDFLLRLVRKSIWLLIEQ